MKLLSSNLMRIRNLLGKYTSLFGDKLTKVFDYDPKEKRII